MITLFKYTFLYNFNDMLNIYRNCIQKISRMKERLTNKLLLLIKINQI